MALSRKESNGRKRVRLLAVSYFKEGLSRTEIALRLKVARGSVNKLVSNFLQHGLSGLENKPIQGRPHSLTQEQLKLLGAYIEKQIECTDEGGRLTGQANCRLIQIWSW